MKELVQSQCYKLHLKGFMNKQIAIKLKITEAGVSKAITEFTSTDQYQLGQLSIITFLDWFEKAAKFWHMQNSEYQDLIDQIDNLLPTEQKGKKKKPLDLDTIKAIFQKVELTRRLKGSQDSNMERIVYLAKEGEIIMAIKLMKDMLVSMPKKPKVVKIITADIHDVKEPKPHGKTTKR